MGGNERWATVGISHKKLIVWGASDQFRVNYPILNSLGCQVEAVIDDTPGLISPFEEVSIYEGEQGLDRFLYTHNTKNIGFIVAIGNPHGDVRIKLSTLMKAKHLFPVSFADETALICKSVVFGEGLQVMPLALVHNNVKIGDQCILNTRALIEHDCVIEDGVEIGPGAVLCGRVSVGQNSWIGANATIRPRVSIGDNTIIGAGAVVVSDIPSNVIAFGVPARVHRENGSKT